MQPDIPTISIVTPSFNQGQFIERTIQSVLSQNYPKLELIVMDGGSTDETLLILKKYKSKISFVSQKDKGQSDALNQGIAKATGSIIGYLNSDDMLMPGSLKKVAANFMAHPKRLWLTGDYIIVNQDDQPIQTFVVKYKQLLRNHGSSSLLSVANYIAQPSTFWRASANLQVGKFDESLHYCMDFDFWLRLYQLQQPMVVKTALSKFRIHTNSKGGSMYQEQFAQEHEVIKRYTTSRLLRIAHAMHAQAIIMAYKLLKK